jgi:hypothetical protein
VLLVLRVVLAGTYLFQRTKDHHVPTVEDCLEFYFVVRTPAAYCDDDQLCVRYSSHQRCVNTRWDQVRFVAQHMWYQEYPTYFVGSSHSCTVENTPLSPVRFACVVSKRSSGTDFSKPLI